MTEKTTQQIIDESDKVLDRVNWNSEFRTIHARDLNRRERLALKRVVHFVQDREAYNGVTSVRFEMNRCNYFVSVIITTRRSDCGKYSPRALMCDSRIHFFIGPRGGLTIKTAECGFGNNSRAHFKRMLRAK